MAIYSLNGMDDISSVQEIVDKGIPGDFNTAAGTITYLPGGGIAGGGAIELASGAYLGIPPKNGALGLLGWFKLPSGFDTFHLFTQANNGDLTSTDSSIRVLSDGSVEARGDGGAFLGLLFPAGTVQPDTFYYFCAYRYKFSTGLLRLKLNNIVAEVAGDTQNLSSERPTFIKPSTGGVILDDLCLTSTDYTDLPPQQVYCLIPNADRVAQDFGHVGVTTAHEAIAELPPDDAVSYIFSGTEGAVSEFELSDLPEYVTEVAAVDARVRASRDDAGGNANLISRLSLSSGELVVEAGGLLADDSWVNYRPGIVEVNPSTSQPFTPAEVNGIYSSHEVAV